jgi:hypothetical protein
MNLAATPRVLSWCFDDLDIGACFRPAASPSPSSRPSRLTTEIALDLIFGELAHEADRPIRDRLNEVLRQWHLRTFPPEGG